MIDISTNWHPNLVLFIYFPSCFNQELANSIMILESIDQLLVHCVRDIPVTALHKQQTKLSCLDLHPQYPFNQSFNTKSQVGNENINI